MCAATIEFARSPSVTGLKDVRFVMLGRDAAQQVQSEFFNSLLAKLNSSEIKNPGNIVDDHGDDNSPDHGKRRRKKTTKNNYYADNNDQKQSDLPESNNTNHRYVVDVAVKKFADTKGAPQEENCTICLKTMTKPKKLDCGHVFCEQCIEDSFKYQRKCPNCGRLFGEMKGTQPKGKMMTTENPNINIPGYEGYGAIVIEYMFEDGIQGVRLIIIIIKTNNNNNNSDNILLMTIKSYISNVQHSRSC